MAITWNYDEKCGEATFKNVNGHTYNVDLYVGNCFLLMIDGNDNLHSFFVDADHMKRCLENGIFSDLVFITINKAKCRNYKAIVALLAEYLDDIDISVYKDGEYTWKEYAPAWSVIPDMRMRELAELAISYLDDENLIEDFAEDRDVEFNDSEKEYFGIYEWRYI